MITPGSLEAMTGMEAGVSKKKPTHRGKRGGKRKGSAEYHAEAKTHLANAQSASTPEQASGHLFKALTALNAAKSAGASGANAGGAPMQQPTQPTQPQQTPNDPAFG